MSNPYKDFGAWLKELRVRAGFESQSNVELRGGSRLVNQGKLSHIERGLNKNPSPDLLRALSSLYQRPYRELIARWVEARFGVDLVGTKFALEDFLTDDELRCLERYRRLSDPDRRWLHSTLDRMTGEPEDGRFRNVVADGIVLEPEHKRRRVS